MIDVKATECINKAVLHELRKINKKHGLEYHSTHEGYGVLLEEVQECSEEVQRMGAQLEALWIMIRSDDNKRLHDQLEIIRQFALSCAEEAVQVAAVCEKFKNTMQAIEIFGDTI